MRRIESKTHVCIGAAMTAISLCAGVGMTGCSGPHELFLGQSQTLLESERAALEMRPASYDLKQGWPGLWNVEFYTSDFSLWGEERISRGCYRLTVPSGRQHVEVRNVWSNGWEETLAVDFVASPGKTYDFYFVESPKPTVETGKELSIAESAGFILLSGVLWPLTPILVFNGVPHARPGNMECGAWVACRGENTPIASFSTIEP